MLKKVTNVANLLLIKDMRLIYNIKKNNNKSLLNKKINHINLNASRLLSIPKLINIYLKIITKFLFRIFFKWTDDCIF